MSLFSEIEKTIERGFRRWTERMFGPAEAGELMTVHRAILEQVETRIQIVARGRRLFPFSHITVTLVSPEAERRTMLQAAFGEDNRLEHDIRESLEGAGCQLPGRFSVEVKTAEAGEHAFEIEYGVDAAAAPAPEPPGKAPVVAGGRLVVVKGKAERAEYELSKTRVNIGRLAELTDSEHRLMRRNDVVFEEGADEANSTVSRKHAHIRLDAGDYRICDDESEFGTRVFRDGRPIEVPAGNRRGEKLRPGD
jgi:hypothetical protein